MPNWAVIFSVSADILSDLESFICNLYGLKDIGTVNEVRYYLFKNGKFSDETLPPNDDCLLQHIKRANYQAAIWRRCLVNNINPPPATSHGWKVDSDEVSIHWMDNKCAPDSLLNGNCSCKTGCDSQRCSCKKNHYRCSILCKCKDCKNQLENNGEDDENDEDVDFDVNDSESDYCDEDFF